MVCFLLYRVGGSLPVIIPYTSEFNRNKYRGSYMGVQAFFWMIGQLTCRMLAWAIIPIRLFHLFGRELESWRIFIAICALPSLIGAVMYFFLPEIPRFLLKTKVHYEFPQNCFKTTERHSLSRFIKSILPSLMWLVTLSHCCYQRPSMFHWFRLANTRKH